MACIVVSIDEERDAKGENAKRHCALRQHTYNIFLAGGVRRFPPALHTLCGPMPDPASAQRPRHTYPALLPFITIYLPWTLQSGYDGADIADLTLLY